MKKIFLSLLFTLILFSNGFGKTVEANRAKTVVSNYLASMPTRFPQGVPGGLTLCYTASEWTTLDKGPLQGKVLKSSSGVNSLITTLWDQSPFYNDLCPFDNTANERTVTGFVATAMAQVMKYHAYPTTGIGSYSYSTTRYGTLSANSGQQLTTGLICPTT